MEKLIELLNEYAHTYADHYDDTGEEIECKFLHHTDQCFTYEEEGKYDTLVDDVIISKRYGFIKRLVDNDKIDNSKFYDKNILKGFMTLTKKEKADSIIMNLSIQDEPMELLISILK